MLAVRCNVRHQHIHSCSRYKDHLGSSIPRSQTCDWGFGPVKYRELVFIDRVHTVNPHLKCFRERGKANVRQGRHKRLYMCDPFPPARTHTPSNKVLTVSRPQPPTAPVLYNHSSDKTATKPYDHDCKTTQAPI